MMEPMAVLSFSMNQSLDGNVAHDAFAPGPLMFAHFIDQVAGLSGSIYGRTMYEVMRYWDEDQPDWVDAEKEYAEVWRRQPKWVVSRTLDSVGPNATLVRGDVAREVARIRAEHDGRIEVAGPTLAAGLGALGLIDEYVIYLHPVVAGPGPTFFGDDRPRLELVAAEPLAEGVVKLTYAPAGTNRHSRDATAPGEVAGSLAGERVVGRTAAARSGARRQGRAPVRAARTRAGSRTMRTAATAARDPETTRTRVSSDSSVHPGW